MTQSGAQRKRDNVIDESLKRVYAEALDEGVPERFRMLLDELKKQEQNEGPHK